MRHGLSSSVSLAIGMAIFVLTVASAFLLLQGSMGTGGGFSEQVVSAANYALDLFHDRTEWTVYRQPVFIHSAASLASEPLELDVPFATGTVPGSILYMKDGNEVVSQHDFVANTSVVVTNVRQGTTRLDLVYTTDHSLPDRTYTSSLEQVENDTWNDELNVTFSDNGFQQVTFKELDMLTAESDIGASSYPLITSELLRTNATYDEADRKEVRVYDRTGKIRITERFSGETVWTFNLTDNFTTMYSSATGGTVNIDGSDTLYADTTDLVDFSDAYGFSIMGDGLFVTVSRETSSAPIDVRVNFTDDGGKKDIVLYAHEGDYTAALAQEQNVDNPYNVSVGVPVAVRGISRAQASSLESQSYETVQEELGLVGSAYNITIPGVFEKGEEVGLETTVHVFEFPVPVLQRFANATVKDLRMRVWDR